MTLLVAGAADSVKSGGGLTVNVTVVLCTNVPLVAVMVRVTARDDRTAL